MIEIDTESTLYVCTDGANAEVHLLVPKGRKFKLLCESDMEHHTFDI